MTASVQAPNAKSAASARGRKGEGRGGSHPLWYPPTCKHVESRDASKHNTCENIHRVNIFLYIQYIHTVDICFMKSEVSKCWETATSSFAQSS